MQYAVATTDYTIQYSYCRMLYNVQILKYCSTFLINGLNFPKVDPTQSRQFAILIIQQTQTCARVYKGENNTAWYQLTKT